MNLKHPGIRMVLILLCALLPGALAYGQLRSGYSHEPADSTGRIYLDLPLLALPSQSQAYKTTGGFFRSYMNPGMETSIAYTVDVYTAAHYGIKKLIKIGDHGKLEASAQRLAICAFDYLVMSVPLATGWLHEEYHRAVMTQYGINSFNEMLLFPIGAETVSVSHIRDEQLAMLNDGHHPDFVRLNGAGHEAEVELTRQLQANQFFYHQTLGNGFLYWLNAFENLAYILSCADGSGDETTAELNAKEPTIESRDFTGMDMSAWAYALSKPDLPYAARGTHPSGVGINRYIVRDDIAPEGLRFLKRHTGLDVLNFISPMMIGISRIKLAETERGTSYGNFAFRHYLASFGGDSALDLYLQTPDVNLYSTVHVYDNYEHLFGGLEAGVVDLPLLDGKMLLGGAAMAWVQPAQMSFYTAKGSVGGLLKARASYQGRCVEPYAELGFKTPGWVAGNVNLGRGFFLRAGLRWRLSL